MERLPAELISEIAESTLAIHGKAEISALSRTSSKIRDNSIPFLCRSITMRDGLGAAKSQVKSLCQTGMAKYVHCLTLGAASFIPKGQIDAITKEANLIASLSGIAHNERNYSYENLIRPEIDWSSHSPSSIDQTFIQKLLKACSSRITCFKIRNVSSLDTDLLDNDGYETGRSTAAKYARDYIYSSLQAFEPVFFKGFAEVVNNFAWETLSIVDFHVWQIYNLDPILLGVEGKSNKLVGPTTLMLRARRVRLSAAHTCAVGERTEDINSHDRAMAYLLHFASLSSNSARNSGGRLTELELALTKNIGINPRNSLGIPCYENLTRISLDDMYIFGRDLEDLVTKSTGLRSLKLEYVDIHSRYVKNQAGTYDLVPFEEAVLSGSSVATWASFLETCSHCLGELIEVEFSACGYSDTNDSVGMTYQAGGYAKEVGVDGSMLYSHRREDYEALKILLTAVSTRRCLMGLDVREVWRMLNYVDEWPDD